MQIRVYRKTLFGLTWDQWIILICTITATLYTVMTYNEQRNQNSIKFG